jgi:NAD(P) transhydrogenase subunit alpha
MTNAISAVTVLGALMVFAVKTDLLEGTLGVLALVMAMFNVVGGFAITYRMLKLFKKSGPSDR